MKPDPIKMCLLKRTAFIETVSFAILIVFSVLKRTTEFNAVPVMGPIHGALFVVLVYLIVIQREALGWSAFKTLVVCTIGSPFAHFFVRKVELQPL